MCNAQKLFVSLSTFTEICEEIEKLKVAVNLDPCVKYDCHGAVFQKPLLARQDI